MNRSFAEEKRVTESDSLNNVVAHWYEMWWLIGIEMWWLIVSAQLQGNSPGFKPSISHNDPERSRIIVHPVENLRAEGDISTGDPKKVINLKKGDGEKLLFRYFKKSDSERIAHSLKKRAAVSGPLFCSLFQKYERFARFQKERMPNPT